MKLSNKFLMYITSNKKKANFLVSGLGNFDEACNDHRSHAVAVDKGFMTSIIMAHEVGHV